MKTTKSGMSKQKLQHKANIPQGSHILFKFSITVMQINKIDLTLTSNLINPIPNSKPDPKPNPKCSHKKT